jgi:O-antigen ligase
MILGEEDTVQLQTLGIYLANRVQGTLFHPNSYAMYLTTVIPFGLALLFSKVKTYLKVLTALGLCLGVIALIYSLSRSAWINFLVIICIVLMLIKIQTAALIAGAALLILIGLIFFGPDLILARLTSNDQGSAVSRITLAQTALAMINDHPWFGVGLGNYIVVLPQYSPPIFGYALSTVHNAYLLILAETGVIGLIGFLVLLAGLMFQNWQITNQAPDDLSWVAGVGVFCAFVAMALHSLTDYALLGNILLTAQFWLLAGLSTSLMQRISYKEPIFGAFHALRKP